MGSTCFATIFAGLLAVGVGAQDASTAIEPEGAESEWAFSASAYTYLVPDGGEYLQPTITADRRWLHLEARYNYEDLKTGSAWVGYNFSVGEELSLDITPMLGAVFGRTTGIAPGYRVSLDWRRLELYSESEFVLHTDERADSFFYSWSEVTLSPVDWLRAGLVVQRTRVYESPREIQRGFLVGLSFEPVEITAHVFNPDESKPLYVISVSVGF